KQRTPEHTAVFAANFLLKSVVILAIPLQPLQRRNGRRKNSVEINPMLFPLLIQRHQREVRLRLEEIIEAPFLDSRLLADLIDRRAAEGTRPEQFSDGFHQSIFCITDSTHIVLLFSDPALCRITIHTLAI